MQSETKLKFRKIIDGCIRKDRPSQNQLYKLFYAYGMSVCIRYVNSESEALIVLNDGFLKVFQNIKKFDLDKSFKPWFRKIIVNTALSHLKSQKKYNMEVDIDNAEYVPTNEDILSKISYKELTAMIQTLSSAYRTVFNMYVIDGFKHDEIAEQLGITVSTSKSNLARARVKLRDLVTTKYQKINT